MLREESMANPNPADQPVLPNRLSQMYPSVELYFAIKIFPVPEPSWPLPKSASPVATPVTTTFPELSTATARGPRLPPIELTPPTALAQTIVPFASNHPITIPVLTAPDKDNPPMLKI